MKIEEIQQLKDAISSLSPEQKEVAKSILMKQLAQIDNLGEVNSETLNKINGGVLPFDPRRLLGYWIEKMFE